MTVKLQTEHYLEFLSLTGGCTGSSEYTLVKIPHCWKSHVAAHFFCFQQRLQEIRHRWTIYGGDKGTVCCVRDDSEYEEM